MFIDDRRIKLLAQSLDNIEYNMHQMRYAGEHQSQRYQEAQSELKGWKDALYYAGLKEIVNSQRKIPENS